MKLKLKNVLTQVLNEGMDISKSDKDKITDKVIEIMYDERLEFEPEFVEIRAPKKIDSLHIDLPIVPSDRVKKRIILLLKQYGLTPDGNDAIASKRGHKMMSMSFKKV